MPSPSPKILCLCYMLSSSLCWAVNLQRQPVQAESLAAMFQPKAQQQHKMTEKQRKALARAKCPCQPWNKVYGQGAGSIGCSFGTRLATQGVGGLNGVEWCNFAERFHSSACLSNAMGVADKSNAVCYISQECAQIEGSHAPFVQKKCILEDKFVQDMPLSELADQATQDGIDIGNLAMFGAKLVDKDPATLTPAELESYKGMSISTNKKSAPYIILSFMNAHGPRMHVRGTEVYNYTMNQKQTYDWKCWQGCSDLDDVLSWFVDEGA